MYMYVLHVPSWQHFYLYDFNSMDTNIGYIISKIAYGIIPVVYNEENELEKQRMNKK